MSSRRRAAAGFALLLAVAGASGPAGAVQPPLQQRPAGDEDALRERSRAGDAESQYELGMALMARNDDASLKEARDWLLRALRSGHVEAQNAYSGLLINGSGGPKDEAGGRRLLLDAARRGSVGANVTLSIAHLDGSGGFERDERRAFQHMQAAAMIDKPKNGWALWRLGMMHLNGIGTPKNPEEAYRWVTRAAEKGSVSGMTSRAVMLATGEGVAKNPVEARTWYERAARSGEDGWAHALRGLGGMLLMGEGGAVDLPRGFGYLLVAHAQGDEHAATLIEMTRSRITPQIEKEAVAVAEAWVKANAATD